MTEREQFQQSPAWHQYNPQALPPTPPSVHLPGGQHISSANSPMVAYGGPMGLPPGYPFPPMHPYGYPGQPTGLPPGLPMMQMPGGPLVHPGQMLGPQMRPMAPPPNVPQGTIIYIPDGYMPLLYPEGQNGPPMGGPSSAEHGQMHPGALLSPVMGPAPGKMLQPQMMGGVGQGGLPMGGMGYHVPRGSQHPPYPSATSILQPTGSHSLPIPASGSMNIPTNPRPTYHSSPALHQQRPHNPGNLAINTNVSNRARSPRLSSADTATPNTAASGNSPTRSSHSSSFRSPTRTAAVKAKGAKRPANSWILYRQEKHPIVLAEHEGITNNEISKIVAEMWKAEPEHIKNIYKTRAEEERRRHRLLHPDYKYAPRKNKPKRRKRKPNSASHHQPYHQREGSGEATSPTDPSSASDAWPSPTKDIPNKFGARPYMPERPGAEHIQSWVDSEGSDSGDGPSPVSPRGSFEFNRFWEHPVDPHHQPQQEQLPPPQHQPQPHRPPNQMPPPPQMQPGHEHYIYDGPVVYHQDLFNGSDFTFEALGFPIVADDSIDAEGSDAGDLSIEDLMLADDAAKPKKEGTDNNVGPSPQG
ncbi:uncharacterized protein SPPG_07085 [Spizellomyces punctatus DAOM BR117]|uniref:HMG box domain-containing protein n=1 Tax=Spizellomyces punctatus (strain DAOM BR117) TaxID=645134 RepID=A0A0L0H8V8_SPIPD|nr:uncharacterized protein SPPG_07085 [Spizellomyces punctatus DAOM BR117]KNC97617.1 hypothetical protein SPPG_07085 [Spizellomyces punctatus DAOM BR117]|eukprot:XP_016605657.1 hypothetical protein SPPG_07085 [Spizellomyces punctatus DAOM BR117]